MSETRNFRLNFMAAKLLLNTIEAEAKSDIVSFRKMYPNGEAELAGLKADLDHMFDVLREHEKLEAEALKS